MFFQRGNTIHLEGLFNSYFIDLDGNLLVIFINEGGTNTPLPTLSIAATFANEDGDPITVTTEEITIE